MEKEILIIRMKFDEKEFREKALIPEGTCTVDVQMLGQNDWVSVEVYPLDKQKMTARFAFSEDCELGKVGETVTLERYVYEGIYWKVKEDVLHSTIPAPQETQEKMDH